MRLMTIAVWSFINIIFFGMCGYMYLVWSKYWISMPKEDLQQSIESQLMSFDGVTRSSDKHQQSLLLAKVRRSAVGHYRKNKVANKANNTGIADNKVIKKSHGSPRFPNIHSPVLEFDSGRYSCNDSTSIQCVGITSSFRELVEKEFHRVLMSESRVFKSGLASQNIYNVHFDGEYGKRRPRGEVLCALGRVRVRTVTRQDQPFARLGFSVPPAPLQPERAFNTCAVVSSSGALLGSRLGSFIDSHDMVLRFNNAPTTNFTEDVGSKTTFRVLNSQVVTKPKFRFLHDPLYDNVSIIIWDPSNYSSSLEDWYRHPDFPLFDVYKEFLELKPDADVHLLMPQVLWDIWTVLQESSPYRIRKNPPSSGFIGIWFATQRCSMVRVLEYVPSARASNRCHYYSDHRDRDCTLGSWHPLALEKLLASQLRDNSDFEVFQRGFINIPGVATLNCPA
ncbi:beta-galactoside-a-2,6-sialyltransferase [Choristoneura fumiferana]|uniref:beta-galactoside-a-2,6-sialyltransferase n=1 Tax=Choristoneura fumiferana TaxID=7141 RepID=UPI003D15649D